MRKLAGVGYDHSEEAGRLAWILQTTDSKSGGCRTRTLSSYWSVCVTDYRRRDGWYLGFFSLSACLGAHKTIPPEGLEKRRRESGVAGEEGGRRKEDMKG